MSLRLEKLTLFLLIAAGTFAVAQSSALVTQEEGMPVEAPPDAATKLSPGASYREAIRPLEITHRSIANWSDIEQASLAIAVKQSSVACAKYRATDYTGDSLIDLSRLCATGLAWPMVIGATARYLNEKVSPKSYTAEAYAAKINAELEMHDQPSALRDGNAMLGAVPYDGVVADASNELINYLELLYTNDAVAFATRREVIIRTLLETSAFASSLPAQTTAVRSTPTLIDLYRQGLVLARLQQLVGHPDAASETIATLDKALPSNLPGDDSAAIQAIRGQYAQLGQPLGTIVSLGPPSVRNHRLPTNDGIVVLLLFPDWCAQGIRLAQEIPKGEFSVENYRASMYALLVKTVPAEQVSHTIDNKAPKEKGSFDPAIDDEYLKGTPTFTVSPALLQRFYAVDVPLLIITDNQGVIRLIDVADENILQPGNTVDSAVALIGKQWPTAIVHAIR
jgi:hypothetical protein